MYSSHWCSSFVQGTWRNWTKWAHSQNWVSFRLLRCCVVSSSQLKFLCMSTETCIPIPATLIEGVVLSAALFPSKFYDAYCIVWSTTFSKTIAWLVLLGFLNQCAEAHLLNEEILNKMVVYVLWTMQASKGGSTFVGWRRPEVEMLKNLSESFSQDVNVLYLVYYWVCELAYEILQSVDRVTRYFLHLLCGWQSCICLPDHLGSETVKDILARQSFYHLPNLNMHELFSQLGRTTMQCNFLQYVSFKSTLHQPALELQRWWQQTWLAFFSWCSTGFDFIKGIN